MKLVQVVPRTAPALGGVLAYAEALAGELARRQGIESELVAVDGSLAGTPLPAATCLVHYVNYAYQSRGCPVALVRDLRRWRAAAPDRRLVTFFHEVYATGPLWRSSFWLAPVQRRLAAVLARGSDRVATSLPRYGRTLARWRGAGGGVAVTPVFSTVGEPETVPPLAQRPPRLLVFGGRGVRERAYGREREALAAACRALGIEEIVDLGPAPAAPGTPARVAGIPVRSLGPLAAAEVSATMLQARAGFVSYPSAYLSKSTIFAAYCAHGLLPVHAWPPEGQASDGGPPGWTPGSPFHAGDLQARADAARAWYREHSLPRQAESFRALLRAAGAAP